jgi:hypothetical protein
MVILLKYKHRYILDSKNKEDDTATQIQGMNEITLTKKKNETKCSYNLYIL